MILNYADEIKDIYKLFADEQSRCIFKNRLMYNLFNEQKYIRNIIMSNQTAKDFLSSLLSEDTPIAVWGIGIRAEKFVNFYPEVKIACFIDSYKYGQTFCRYPVISPQEFVQNYPNTKIVILPRFFYKDIIAAIKKLEIEDNRILNFASVMDQLYEAQYFDLPQLKVDNDGIFVDGGSFDGNDSIKFVVKMHFGESCQIWEPNSIVIPKIIEKMDDNNVKYEIIKAGMSDRKSFAVIHCKEGELSVSSLEEEDDGSILLDCIDNHMEQKISMIKMDIEGFEYKALQGAKQAIQKYKPVLAICVYHKKEDIWEIPKLISSICSGYKLYLRHYSLFANETVLYGIYDYE